MGCPGERITLAPYALGTTSAYTGPVYNIKVFNYTAMVEPAVPSLRRLVAGGMICGLQCCLQFACHDWYAYASDNTAAVVLFHIVG